MSAAPALESFSASELDAIATLWRRERRTLVTSFNGTSMLPAIAPAQEVFIECGADAVVGDVIVFRFNNQVLVHRVVARTAAWLLTWGDANFLPDDPVEPARVIGTVKNTPAMPHSNFRAMLLRVLTSPRTPIDVLKRRVRLLLRVRWAWSQGPIAFAGTIARAVARRLLPR